MIHHSAAALKGRVREDWRSLPSGKMGRLGQPAMSRLLGKGNTSTRNGEDSPRYLQPAYTPHTAKAPEVCFPSGKWQQIFACGRSVVSPTLPFIMGGRGWSVCKPENDLNCCLRDSTNLLLNKVSWVYISPIGLTVSGKPQKSLLGFQECNTIPIIFMQVAGIELRSLCLHNKYFIS